MLSLRGSLPLWATTTRRTSELLDTDGSIVSGPHRDAVRTRRTKNLRFLHYHQSV